MPSEVLAAAFPPKCVPAPIPHLQPTHEVAHTVFPQPCPAAATDGLQCVGCAADAGRRHAMLLKFGATRSARTGVPDSPPACKFPSATSTHMPCLCQRLSCP